MTPADEPISSEAGQALIRLAAEAAAAGDFDRAIAAQRQAVEMAGRLFGKDSDENAIATVNLGSLYFRAQRPAEAFDSYRDGLERLFARGAASDLHGQALENLLDSGMTAGRTAETGQALLTLAKHGKAWPGSINLAKPAAMAFVTAGHFPEALDAFEVALACQAGMDAPDARRWVRSIMGMALGLAENVKGPERARLASLVTVFAANAAKGGWNDAFVAAPQWAKLANDLALPAEAAIDAAADADALRQEPSIAASARTLADDIKGSIIGTIDANADAMPDVAARRDELAAVNEAYLFDYALGLVLFFASIGRSWTNEETGRQLEAVARDITRAPTEVQEALALIRRTVGPMLDGATAEGGEDRMFKVMTVHLHKAFPGVMTLLTMGHARLLAEVMQQFGMMSISASGARPPPPATSPSTEHGNPISRFLRRLFGRR